ncbi:alpha-ketoglutarate-dependent dioxygenase AlkB [Fulvivirga sediminis]|uniref:Alpha-ketoglutarate-dependent dioxygenase AlkB n=1 Tax=Fulvivirga sediminis TaxID=2803949 RepID=A0A937K0W6_9BACT|nr:alpha-ketoglutarate-dependent dioxygenase AlkB [Fulvivirga sediminis]MBL3658763.1 alpha-ketoglutarate-dependent dioxygenase AlkB [Fulvivirga sediminis]
MTKIGFHKITIDLERNLFEEFSNSVSFEPTGKGRLCNHLVYEEKEGIPLVRTTTSFNKPAHHFSAKHGMLADKIKSHFEEIDHLASLNFNNALIEVYNQHYKKMKYHSDQCLDIDKNSYIALFSCYEKPEELTEQSIRKLKVKDKDTDEEFEFELTHNSVVLFSVTTNTKYLHKIVLEPVKGLKPLTSDNRWLGITFRKSNTFIQFKDETPYLINGSRLKLADESQKKAFFELRGEENKNPNFVYPVLNYTISPADLLPPISSKV